MNAVRWNFSSPSIGNTDSVYTYSSQIADSIFGKIFYYVSGINWRPMASFNDFCHMDGKRFPLSNHTKYSSSQFPKERIKNTLYTHKKKSFEQFLSNRFLKYFPHVHSLTPNRYLRLWSWWWCRPLNLRKMENGANSIDSKTGSKKIAKGNPPFIFCHWTKLGSNWKGR